MEISKTIKVIELLKKGGQKEVYIADSEKYGKCIYKTGICNSSSSLARIRREVALLQSIDSKYYPKNFEFEFNDLGEFAIIEEYIIGTTLSEASYIRNDESEVINFIIDLVKGLDILWRNDIVHRDIKPDNILINKQIQPVIIDLGIARELAEESLTATFQSIGPCTPIYASPEQLRNEKYSIDKRTDYFAIGIIMAERLLNRHPFINTGDGIDEIMTNIIDGNNNISVNELSDSTYLLLQQLLNPEPFLRPRNTDILIEKLLNARDERIV